MIKQISYHFFPCGTYALLINFKSEFRLKNNVLEISHQFKGIYESLRKYLQKQK